MFDITFIRDHPDAFDAGLARRGHPPMSREILDLDSQRRALLTEMQADQARRNDASRQIGQAMKEGDKAKAEALKAETSALKEKLQAQEEEERQLGARLDDLLLTLPNLPLADVPDGPDETANRLVRKVGDVPAFDFEAREHFDLGETLGMMDFDRAARLSGSRFVVLSGALARLERALGQFMIDLQTTEHGYRETATPVLVRDAALVGTGQLPKFADDLFRAGDHWMIPTAEVTLTNLGREEILEEESLPRRYTALTQCFRAEAGAAGRDTRGMIRQHQFQKVELVSVVTPEEGAQELERMLGCAEEVLKRLGLAYQVLELCTGDMGFSAQRTYDIEVWLPGQGRYREISSCSLCGDFQARRMRMRCRPKAEKKTRFPSTLNGSGLAVGRTLIAVMENYQNADGTITVPEVLRPYMGGLERIEGPLS